MKTIKPPMLRRQRGVALLEAMIAAVILAIGLLGTVGLQARSYAAISDAGQRAEATLAADELLSIMNANNAPAVLAMFEVGPDDPPPEVMKEWALDTRARIPGAKFTVGVNQTALGRAQVDITIAWTRRKGDQESRHQVTSYIYVNP